MLILLELNNIQLKFSQSELVELGIGIAEGKSNPQYIKKWIFKHMEE